MGILPASHAEMKGNKATTIGIISRPSNDIQFPFHDHPTIFNSRFMKT
jgi:hypothetical protein